MASFVYLPPELTEEHVDALIIYSKESNDDENRAKQLRDTIEGITFANGLSGRAVFLDDAVPYIRSYVERLDEAVKFATLIFVIYSETLSSDSRILQCSNAVLWHVIEEQLRNYTYIPVIHGTQSYRSITSILVRAIQPVDTAHRDWENRLKRTLEQRLGRRLKRSEEQAKQRQKYLNNNRSSLESLDALSIEHPSQSTESVDSYAPLAPRARVDSEIQRDNESVSSNGITIQANDSWEDSGVRHLSNDNAIQRHEELIGDRSHHRLAERFIKIIGDNLIFVGPVLILFTGLIASGIVRQR